MNDPVGHPFARQLRAEVLRRRLIQAEIARQTGISQPQVSRILSGKFKRKSGRVMQLCRFLFPNDSAPIAKRELSERLGRAVMDVWDGSQEQEEALIHLLEAIRGLASPRLPRHLVSQEPKHPEGIDDGY